MPLRVHAPLLELPQPLLQLRAGLRLLLHALLPLGRQLLRALAQLPLLRLLVLAQLSKGEER